MDRPGLNALGALAPAALFVLVLRLAILHVSQIDLGPDETQYWFWSLTPDWGYYSKPPLIAWVIAGTTAVFGDAEWAVRLSAPLFHFGTSLLLGVAGARAFDARVGFWAGLLWTFLPSVSLSANLMTTDVPLLFFVALALVAFVELVRARRFGYLWAVVLGLALGLGLLSKYAMLYVAAGIALALLLAPTWRRRIAFGELAVAALVAGLLLAPNIWWNAQHGFQTVAHTAANANWGRDLFHPAALGDFLVAQFGVFGPFLFPALLLAIPAAFLVRREDARAAFAAFALAPLLVVCAQALLSRAHANWAAAAYAPGAILVAATLIRLRSAFVLKASTALHAAAFIALSAGLVNLSVADGAGLSNAVKRVRGWDAQGADVAAFAENYDVILVDDRELTGEILYYARPRTIPVQAWNPNGIVDNHYEAFIPFEPRAGARVLLVTQAEAPDAAQAFERAEKVGESVARLDETRTRTLSLWSLEGYRGAPAAR